MRNPLNAGAQVNVTSPLFDENKNYLYSNLELTPNVFAHIAMSLCRGTQRSRGDVITGIVVYHQTHPFSTPEQQDGGIEPPPVLSSRFFRFLNLP